MHKEQLREKLEKANPRCTLIEGQLFFHEEDILTFIDSLLTSLQKEVERINEIPLVKKSEVLSLIQSYKQEPK